MEVETFSEIAEEFIEKVHSIVWCNAATTDRLQRPRSRVLHPIWEVVDGRPLGWIATGRHSLKEKHLAERPYLSLAYVHDPLQPTYAECQVAWVDDPAVKKRIWEWFKATPPPLGYDPAPFFGSVDSPQFGVLKCVPWRVELGNLQGVGTVWQP